MISTIRNSARPQVARLHQSNPPRFAASSDANIILISTDGDVWEPHHHECSPDETVGGHMVREWLQGLRDRFKV